MKLNIYLKGNGVPLTLSYSNAYACKETVNFVSDKIAEEDCVIVIVKNGDGQEFHIVTSEIQAVTMV